MEFIEFIEKIAEKQNIVLLPYQKKAIEQIYKAMKEGKEIKISVLKNSGYSFYKQVLKMYIETLKEEEKRGKNMKKLTEREVSNLSEKAIARTARDGAINEIETIAMLEMEIEGYRKKIINLERHIRKIEKEEEPVNEILEALSIPGITINADTVHLTVYPSGILNEEQEVK